MAAPTDNCACLILREAKTSVPPVQLIYQGFTSLKVPKGVCLMRHSDKTIFTAKDTIPGSVRCNGHDVEATVLQNGDEIQVEDTFLTFFTDMSAAGLVAEDCDATQLEPSTPGTSTPSTLDQNDLCQNDDGGLAISRPARPKIQPFCFGTRPRRDIVDSACAKSIVKSKRKELNAFGSVASCRITHTRPKFSRDAINPSHVRTGATRDAVHRHIQRNKKRGAFCDKNSTKVNSGKNQPEATNASAGKNETESSQCVPSVLEDAKYGPSAPEDGLHWHSEATNASAGKNEAESSQCGPSVLEDAKYGPSAPEDGLHWHSEATNASAGKTEAESSQCDPSVLEDAKYGPSASEDGLHRHSEATDASAGKIEPESSQCDPSVLEDAICSRSEATKEDAGKNLSESWQCALEDAICMRSEATIPSMLKYRGSEPTKVVSPKIEGIHARRGASALAHALANGSLNGWDRTSTGNPYDTCINIESGTVSEKRDNESSEEPGGTATINEKRDSERSEEPGGTAGDPEHPTEVEGVASLDGSNASGLVPDAYATNGNMNASSHNRCPDAIKRARSLELVHVEDAFLEKEAAAFSEIKKRDRRNTAIIHYFARMYACDAPSA